MYDLASVKLHCRVDHDDEDEVLVFYSEMISDYFSSIGIDVDPMPLPVKMAGYLLISHYYENRSATSQVSVKAVEIGVADLIAPYRGFAHG